MQDSFPTKMRTEEVYEQNHKVYMSISTRFINVIKMMVKVGSVPPEFPKPTRNISKLPSWDPTQPHLHTH